jgi:large subunit ribosomal protein L28
MAKCDLCGKLPQFGHSIPKSQQRTKRRWKPNIQRVTVMMDGRAKRMSVCVKCLRSLHKT